MNGAVLDDIRLEQIAKEHFGLNIEISKVILREVPTSRTSEATVFLTKKKQLLVFISGRSRLLLSDVKKMVTRMGLKAELYFPPKNHKDYFNDIGREKFREVFPGRGDVKDEDIIFYRTLAPYNPALVLIEEVKNGEIFGYDSDARSDWRVAAKFAYRRIKTS